MTPRAPVPWTRIDGGLRVALRLTPRGGRDRIDGVTRDAEGRPALGARVSAPPTDGQANAALVRLLAKTLRAPKSAIRIARGASARIKIIEIDGDPAALEAAFRAALPDKA